MKKLLMILLASTFLISACNGDNTENSNGNDDENDQAEENDENNNENETADEQQKDTYQIGETAEAESSSYGFPYEVTVNEFEITADEVNGYTIEEFFSESSDPGEDTRFSVVNITVANTGEYVLSVNDTMTPT